LSERPSKRTVDEPSFLARSQTVATPSAAMSIGELITRPRPAGLSSGELLLGHGSPFPLLGKALRALSAKMEGCLAQSASPPRSLEPMLATFGTLPSGTAGPSSRSGTASEPCPLSTEGESPSSAAEATTYAAMSRRFRVPWNGHRTRCSRRGDRPFRNGERASRPSRA
jgi:hypothetical protein